MNHFNQTTSSINSEYIFKAGRSIKNIVYLSILVILMSSLAILIVFDGDNNLRVSLIPLIAVIILIC